MIARPGYLAKIEKSFAVHPVTAILGPRQCGKTTLARRYAVGPRVHFFDLENPMDASALAEPLRALDGLDGLVVLDEIQRRPKILEILRVLADRVENPARFLVLGSASPDLMRGASETLAGRVGFVDLSGFHIEEVGSERRDELWQRGGFPRSFLASTDEESAHWREAFVRTFLERDVPQLGIDISAETLRRFWTMVAHYHGQRWNAAEFARSLGSAEATARHYLDILVGAYMVRRLPPWHENLKKREVKAPKIYVRDSGILHTLLTIDSLDALRRHPKLGASWEGFALETILSIAGSRDAYFWAAHSGPELDLLLFRRGERWGFEIKYGDAPRPGRSLEVARADLRLDRTFIVYPGDRAYALDRDVHVVPLRDIGPVLRGEDARGPASARGQGT
jgi:predicted AAA+ superfamily ATPase